MTNEQFTRAREIKEEMNALKELVGDLPSISDGNITFEIYDKREQRVGININFLLTKYRIGIRDSVINYINDEISKLEKEFSDL